MLLRSGILLLLLICVLASSFVVVGVGAQESEGQNSQQLAKLNADIDHLTAKIDQKEEKLETAVIEGTNPALIDLLKDNVKALTEEKARLQTERLAVVTALARSQPSKAASSTGATAAVPPPPHRPPSIPSSMHPDPMMMQMSHSFSDYFVPTGTITFPSSSDGTSPTITCFEVLAFTVRSPAASSAKRLGTNDGGAVRVFNIVVVGTSDGYLHFYDPSGDGILAYFAGRPILSLTMDSSDVIPLLAVVGADGTVTTHSLTLWRGDVILAGPRSRVVSVEGETNEDGTPKKRKMPPPTTTNKKGLAMLVEDGVAIRVQGGGGACDGDGELGESLKQVCSAEQRVSSVLFHSPRGTGTGSTRKIIAATPDGSLSIYHAKNGTHIKSFQLPESAAPNPPIAKTGLTVAIGVGSDVLFLNIMRFDKVAQTCAGIPGETVVSLAFDALQPVFLYVGLSGGDVLVFNTKHRPPAGGSADLAANNAGSYSSSSSHSSPSKPSSSSSATVCKLMHKAPRPPGARRSAPQHLVPLRGYALSGSPSSNGLSVWNVTGVREGGARFLFESEAPREAYEGWSLASSVGSGAKIDNLLLAVREGEGKITVYSHLLPYNPPSHDVAWMRVPLIFVGIVLVLGYNYVKKNGIPGLGRGGRRGMPDMSAAEIEALGKLKGVEGFDMAEFEKFMTKGGIAGLGGGRQQLQRGGGGGGRQYGGSSFGGQGFGGLDLGPSSRGGRGSEGVGGGRFGAGGFRGGGAAGAGGFGQFSGGAGFNDGGGDDDE